MARAGAPALYLASHSPRRRELLARLADSFQCLDVEIDETWDGREPPAAYVARLALEKARAGRAAAPCELPVLGADTEVVLDSRVLGKPRDTGQALQMLGSLSGRMHRVYSAVALIHDTEQSAAVLTEVTFRHMTGKEIRRCCAGAEPLDKAGAYAIQGLAAAFISRLAGSYSAVMGLPLAETARLLAGAGIIMNHATAQILPFADHRLA